MLRERRCTYRIVISVATALATMIFSLYDPPIRAKIFSTYKVTQIQAVLTEILLPALFVFGLTWIAIVVADWGLHLTQKLRRRKRMIQIIAWVVSIVLPALAAAFVSFIFLAFVDSSLLAAGLIFLFLWAPGFIFVWTIAGLGLCFVVFRKNGSVRVI